MMTLKQGLAVAAFALTLPMAMPSTAQAAPLTTTNAMGSLHESLRSDDALLTQVQWRRRGGGWRRGGGAAGLGIGLAAGALIGGAIAAGSNPYYGPGYYGPGYAPAPVYVQPGYAGGDAEAYCMRRYRSYDPASGTYLNNDGNRYPCP